MSASLTCGKVVVKFQVQKLEVIQPRQFDPAYQTPQNAHQLTFIYKFWTGGMDPVVQGFLHVENDPSIRGPWNSLDVEEL